MVRWSVQVVGRQKGLATPRLRGGLRSAVEQARGLRAFVTAHVRLEIRRTADPVEAGLVGRALAEVVWTARGPRRWTARHLDGAIAAVHQRYEDPAGQDRSAGVRSRR
jgi:hypothetical protein